MYGIDISNWQGGINLDTDRYDFAIIKTSEGLGYKDEEFDNFAVQLTKLGKLIGCYHYARPDLRPSIEGMEQEADWFIQTVREYGLLNKSILALDWEQPDYLDKAYLVDAFIDRVKETTGIQCLLYSSNSVLKQYFLDNKYKIWVAYYGDNSSDYEVGALPKPWDAPSGLINWVIWQYTSQGHYPEYSGTIDLDYTPLTLEEWISLANPVNEQKEIITSNMQWAIDTNLYQGYPDGTYKPRQNITREELATVMHRLYERFIK